MRLGLGSIETTLRQVVGSRLLQTIITDREGLAAEIQEIVSLFSGIVVDTFPYADFLYDGSARSDGGEMGC
jgi:hypothetical protein